MSTQQRSSYKTLFDLGKDDTVSKPIAKGTRYKSIEDIDKGLAFEQNPDYVCNEDGCFIDNIPLQQPMTIFRCAECKSGNLGSMCDNDGRLLACSPGTPINYFCKNCNWTYVTHRH